MLQMDLSHMSHPTYLYANAVNGCTMCPEMLPDDSHELGCVVSLNQAEVVDAQLSLRVRLMSPLEGIREGRVLEG